MAVILDSVAVLWQSLQCMFHTHVAFLSIDHPLAPSSSPQLQQQVSEQQRSYEGQLESEQSQYAQHLELVKLQLDSAHREMDTMRMEHSQAMQGTQVRGEIMIEQHVTVTLYSF